MAIQTVLLLELEPTSQRNTRGKATRPTHLPTLRILPFGTTVQPHHMVVKKWWQLLEWPGNTVLSVRGGTKLQPSQLM